MAVSQPNVTFSIEGASALVANSEQKVLMVGQKLAAGTAVSGELIVNHPDDNSEDALFGASSILTNMVKAFKTVNSVTRLDIIPLDDAAGTAATGTITIGGTAADGTGSYTVVIGSRNLYTVVVSVADTDTPTDVATNLVAAINDTVAFPNMPVTASNVAGVVTLTADNSGGIGNSYGLSISGEVTDLTTALTVMSSGATNPTTTGVFDVVDGERYQTVVWDVNLGTTDAIAIDTLTDFLDPRFNVTNDVLDGVGLVTKTDTAANLITLGGTLNSQSLVIMGNKTVNDTLYKAPAMFEIDAIQTAAVAATRALRLTDGANISSLLSGAQGLDVTGGPALSSRPYFNTPFPDFSIIDIGKGFSSGDMEDLLTAGITVVGNNRVRNTVILNETVTTYKTDSAGNPDISFKFLNYVDTSVSIREFFWNNFKAEYAQIRLTLGDLVEGRPMANEGSILSFSNRLFALLSGPDFALTQLGEEALVAFKEGTTISINLACGIVTMVFNSVPIVTQLREVTATMKISFSV